MTAPMQAVPISNLMAIAVVRKLLLELGAVEDPDGPFFFGEPLEVWIVRARPELAGLSPAQTLGRPGGEDRVRSLIRQLLV